MRRDFVIGVVAAFLFGCSFGALVALVFAITIHGHPPGGPWPRGGRPLIQQLGRRLDLSDEQRARIDDILERARRRNEAVRETTRAEIESTLTPRQLARWSEIERRWHRLHPPGPPDGPGPPPGER